MKNNSLCRFCVNKRPEILSKADVHNMGLFILNVVGVLELPEGTRL